MKLLELTEQLLTVCKECLDRHRRMREEDRDPDFYKEVKPYADHWHRVIDEWNGLAVDWIREERPKYVRLVQVTTLDELMKQFTVQSFYRKTGKKRFVESIQSAAYTLNTVKIALEGRKGEDGNER